MKKLTGSQIGIQECRVGLYPEQHIPGFKKSGLSTFNEDIFPENEFLSSYVTDRPMNDGESDPVQNFGTPSTSSNIHTDITGRPSTSKNEASSSISLTNRLIVSLEEIRPYPKALPRKQTRKGRPKGKSLIFTDIPEKELIEAQKLEQT